MGWQISHPLTRNLKPATRNLFSMRFLGNEYNRDELAGAFGDLGTFILFVAAYITLNKMDPLGILMAFASSKSSRASISRPPFEFSP
jgi:hypothetical protein